MTFGIPSKVVGLFTWSLGGCFDLLKLSFNKFKGLCRWIGGTNVGIVPDVPADTELPATPELFDATTTGT